MIARTVSSVVLWAIVFAVVGFGGVTGGALLLAAFSTAAQFEFQSLLAKAGLGTWRAAPLAAGFSLVLLPMYPPNLAAAVWLVLVLGLAAGALACARDAANLAKLAGAVLAIAYVPMLLQFYTWILRDYGWMTLRGGGLGLAIWVIVAAKFTDVGGYLAGKAFGRHKLAPAISPGKTWEGVAGGLALSAAVAALAAHYAADFLPSWLTVGRAACMAVPVGVAAIVSDLSESAFKRCAGMKDSGRGIPGMGGLLDVADSLLFAGPAAFAIFAWFAGDY